MTCTSFANALVLIFIVTSCCSSGFSGRIKLSTIRTSADEVLVVAENVSASDSIDLPLAISEMADTMGSAIYGDTLHVKGRGFQLQHKIHLYYSCRGRRVGPKAIDTIVVIHAVPKSIRHIEFERCGRYYCLEISSVQFVTRFKNDGTFVVGLPRRLWLGEGSRKE